MVGLLQVVGLAEEAHLELLMELCPDPREAVHRAEFEWAQGNVWGQDSGSAPEHWLLIMQVLE